MGFQANVLKVMIASPGDVAEERKIITDALYRWNNANAVSRGLMLQPVKWETHSSPEMGKPAQTLINEHLLIDADIVIGIFGTRIGTATKDFISGSVEEIKRHVAAGRLAMLYFSHVPVDPSSINHEQWALLQAFKEECKAGGMYAEYATYDQLRVDFGQHLTIELNKPKYLWMAKPLTTVDPRDTELNECEKRLLLAAASDRHGQILYGSTTGGFYVQTNDENFVEDSPRSAATWKQVLRRLESLGYLSYVSSEIYEISQEGYSRADREVSSAPLELSLTFEGTPDKQMLLFESSHEIVPKEIEFLLSSETFIAKMTLSGTTTNKAAIPLDQGKIVELFNAPRPDRNDYDFSGPAAVRFVFVSKGRREEVVLTILLQQTFVGNTAWVKLTGSKTFIFK